MSGVVRPASARHTTQAGTKKREPEGSRLSNRNAETDHSVSMKLRSLSERLGCLSLRTAFDSI
ncbi:hypothetical protein D9M68_999960 [compost metagenome]